MRHAMDKQMEPLNQDGLKAARYEMEKSSVRGDKLENAIRAYLEQTPTLPAGKVEAVAERNEVLIEAVDSVMNCAAVMGIKLRTNHGTTEENAWQLANAALKASGAEHIAGLVAKNDELRDALLDMVWQFCSRNDKLAHSFMSAEEHAFDVLDLDNGMTYEEAEAASKAAALPPELRGK